MNKLAHVSLFRFFYSFRVIIILFLTVLALFFCSLPLPITSFPTQKNTRQTLQTNPATLNINYVVCVKGERSWFLF